ncbi:Dolichyl-diphosphooligosaccharide-protein glycosyltransferase 48kDa subunit [Obba rivulosa]|uniref:Dolichyl-diphosphooligosaccharide--protein glycosyltransferase subunit WBP1 n=1 Tax=Obba rivulosa TaxID=1052685 RepID=A0A8E2AYP6_9APHY|nr:Dolichyl-diphosphooligosaccharide-protein glycosyltransferase 48kDa subunit [Obba rivulosa]
MRSFWSLLASVVGLATLLVQAKSSSGDSVLVLLDPSLKRDDFSIFFSGLEEKGYDLTFRSPKDEEPVVIKDDYPQFSHVIIFAPETKSFPKDITPQSLVDLLSKDTNLLLALSPKQTPLTSLASEFSLITPPPGTPLVSHFPERDTPATVIPVNVSHTSPILTPGLPPVWFSGVPFALGTNPLLVPILNAPPESFATDSLGDSDADVVIEASEKGGEGLWAGSQLGLVAGFQPAGGARATWVGGVELFSDEFATKEVSSGVKSGNEQFAADIASWTFQESLVLRVDSIDHHRLNETAPREHYTTNDQIVFTTHISRYNPKTSAWEPYSGIQDLQLEFTMLDPHIRTALPPVPGKPGAYSVTFRAPDRHGVFKFVVDHKRRGWTHLHSSTVIPLVPPRHDEYPRFLSAAWPYYTGAISTSIGFIIFSALWLGGSESKKGKGSKVE